MEVAKAAKIGVLTNISNLKTVHYLRAHTGRVRSCQWAANDENLLSIGADNYICIWDVRSGLICNLIDTTNNQATAADATQDLSVVFAGGLYAKVEAFSHKSRPPEDGYSDYSSCAIFEHCGRINCINWVPNNHLLTAASVDGVVMWDINNVKVENKCPHSADVSAALPISKDGKIFISGAADGVPRMFDLRQSKPLVSAMYGHESEITCIEKHVGDSTFLTGSDDAVVNLYDIRLDYPLANYNRADIRISEYENSEFIEDEHAARVNADMDAGDTAAGEDAPPTGITGVGISPSGRIIITGSRRGSICLWDVFDTTSPLALHREDGPVMALKMARNKNAFAAITWGTNTLMQIVCPN